MKIYIQTNNKQRLASKIAMASFVQKGFDRNKIFFLDIEENSLLKSKINQNYLRGGKAVKFKDDLQSFTPLRFLAPQINNYQDIILVIDPDVFACKDPKNILGEMNENDEICCTFYNGKPRSEVMLINAKKVKWNYDELISKLFNYELDYNDLINLNFENRKIKEINNKYNAHDKIDKETVLLHTTRRITQPWKEGLKVDFDKHVSFKEKFKNKLKKILNMNYNKSITEKFYIRHSNPDVIKAFKTFYDFALSKKLINIDEINTEIKKGNFSKKFLN